MNRSPALIGIVVALISCCVLSVIALAYLGAQLASQAPTIETLVVSTPAAGEGISVSTLSVDTSSNGSSTSTESPTCLSQRVTVPSVTDSPNAGIVIGVDDPLD